MKAVVEAAGSLFRHIGHPGGGQLYFFQNKKQREKKWHHHQQKKKKKVVGTFHRGNFGVEEKTPRIIMIRVSFTFIEKSKSRKMNISEGF